MKFSIFKCLLICVSFLSLNIACSDDDDSVTPSNSGNTGNNNNSGKITLNNLSDSSGTVKIEGAVNKTFSGNAEYNSQVTYFDHTGYEYRLYDPATTDYIDILLVMADSAGDVLPKAGTYTVANTNNTPMGDYVTVGFRSNDTLNEFFDSESAVSGTVTVSNVNDRKVDLEFEVDSLTAFNSGQTIAVDVQGAMKAR